MIVFAKWTDPTSLPPQAAPLLSEAVAGGFSWIARLEQAWRERPFLGTGEGLFLANEGSALLGIAAITRDPYLNNPAIGRLRFVYVREAARGRGLGDQLVEHCLALAAGNWQTLRLHTENETAARIYERRGFLRSTADPHATHLLSCG
jgi:GNAT superfamily N-acetyltransferase